VYKSGRDYMGIIEGIDLKKYFPVGKGPFARHAWLKAVDGISFSLRRGTVFSLVGESGCGKSTVARLILRLTPPTSGRLFFKDQNALELSGDSLKAFRRSVQIIFQDPFASLNPRMTVFDTLAEPLKIHALARKSEFREKVVNLLKGVGLQDEVMNRYPHEFSGGQRQRICIARALAVSPEIIVADEPLSALDVSIQAQILNILQELKQGAGISFLFISHDLRVVQYFSDEVAVMYLGKIVEHAKADELFGQPLHPYTAVLLASAPRMKPGSAKRTMLKGDVPSPIHVPEGCPFHPRCPQRFEPCDKIVPLLEAPAAKGYRDRQVSCHLWNPYEKHPLIRDVS
jgi:oligopeptide/dipeptide ABC transporter ATP-binding protein